MITISIVEIFAAFGAVVLGGIIGGLCGIAVAKLFLNKELIQTSKQKEQTMKIKNREISSAFKKAKKQLYAFTFICNSIEKPWSDTPIVVVCKGIIKERMGYSSTLEWWLYNQHGIYVFDLPKYEEEMLKYRHRWLDELIKEFDVDGYYKG